MGEPVIYINSQKACDLDRKLALQKLYYQPRGYYRTAKKLLDACEKASYLDISKDDINEWLDKQALHQIHKPQPRFIPRASFNNIQIPNECHQADILYMPHDTINKKIFMYC